MSFLLSCTLFFKEVLHFIKKEMSLRRNGMFTRVFMVAR